MTYLELKEVFNNTQTQEKITYLLLFLMPIAGPVIRHWNSYIFVLIFFCSIYFLLIKKNKKPLLKEEKVLLSAFSLFFLSFIISANLNGWTELQTRELGNELMFLWIIPVYLLIREYRFSLHAFFSGILLSIPVIFIFSFIEYFIVPIRDSASINGAYSTIFIGPITALTLLFFPLAYDTWFNDEKNKWWFYLIILMGLFVIVFSYSMTGYLVLMAGGIVYGIFYIKKIKLFFIYICLFLVVAIFGASNVNNVTLNYEFKRINKYFSYLNVGETAKIKRLGTVDARMEMWRASQYAIELHPLFGIGAANQPEFFRKYIEKGEVNSIVSRHGHMHNSFVEAITSKGMVGLIILLILFYYPLYVAWKNRERCVKCYIYAVILSASLTAISIGESMLINKNNAITYFSFFSVILFSHMMRELHHKHFKE